MRTQQYWMVLLTACVVCGHVMAAEMIFTTAGTVSTNIFLAEDTTVTVDDGTSAIRVVDFIGVVSGPGKLTKAGPDRLQLSKANTYSGGTDIEAGRIIVAGNSALGTGTVKLLTAAAQLATAGTSAATVTNDIEVPASGRVVWAAIAPLTLTGHLKHTGTMDAPLLVYLKAGAELLTFNGAMDAENGASVRIDLSYKDMSFGSGANVILTNNASEPTVSFALLETTGAGNVARSLVIDAGANVTMNGIELGGKWNQINSPLNTLEVKGGALTLTGFGSSVKEAFRINHGLTNVIRVSAGTVTAADDTVWSMNNSGSSNTLMQISGGEVSLSQVSLGNQVFGRGYEPSRIDVVVSGGVLEARHKWLWLNQLNHRLCNTLTVNGGTVKLPQTSTGYNEYLDVPCQTRMTLDGGTFVALSTSGGEYLKNVKQLYLGAGGARIDTGTNTVVIDSARFTSLNGAEAAGIVKLGAGRLWLARLPVTGGLIDVQEGMLTLRENADTLLRRVPNDPMYLYAFETDIVTDSTRNAYPATLDSNDSNVQLIAGAGLDGEQAIWLDGSKGLAVVHTNYTEEISEWTLSAWVRQAAAASSDDGNTFLSTCYDDAAEPNTFYTRINPERTFTLCLAAASGDTTDDVTLTTTAIAPLDAWALLTVKADELNGISLYVNGVQQIMAISNGSSSFTTNVYGAGKPWDLVPPGREATGSSTALLIGKKLAAGTVCFSGYMDDVTLYKRALSDSEIAMLHKRASLYEPRVCLAPGTSLDLLSQTLSLSAVMGEGLVSSGTPRITGTLAPGDTNSVAGALLTVSNDLILGTNMLYACDWSEETNDLVAVGNKLTVEGTGSIDLGLDPGSTAFAGASRRVFPIFTYGTIAGAANFADWTVTGTGKRPVAKTNITAADGVVTVKVSFYDGTILLLR